MAKVFLTQNSDRCASDYERAVIDDLIDRGVRYEFESKEATLSYHTPIVRSMGVCHMCGSTNVGQRRQRKLDLWLPDQGIIIELKGKFTPGLRTFMRHMIEQNQDQDIRFFFMRNSWQNNKTKRRTLMDWARAQGIKAAFGDPRENPGTKAYGVGGIPQEWIDE